MLSTVILSIVGVLQNIKFEYLYVALGLYTLLIWGSYILWLWKDTEKRFSNDGVRFLVWFVASITFIFGLLLYLVIRPQQKDDDASWIELERQYLKYEAYGMGKCSSCQFDLRPEFLFCPSCGLQLRDKCKSCTQIIDVSWKICPYCADVQKEEILEPLPKHHVDISLYFYNTYVKVVGWAKSAKENLGAYIALVYANVVTFLQEEVIEEKPEIVEVKKNTKKTKEVKEVKEVGEVKKDKKKDNKQMKTVVKVEAPQKQKKSFMYKEFLDKNLSNLKKLLFMEEKTRSKKTI